MRLRIDDSATEGSAPAQISLTTSTGFSPRLGPNYLLVCFSHRHGREYLEARRRNSHGIVERSGSAGLWRSGNRPRWTAYRIFDPATRADALVRDAGRRHERAHLWLIRSTCKALRHGLPTATQSPRRPTITAFHISSACPSTVAPPTPLSGSTRSILRGHPDGRFVVYSGPDIGTTFSVKAVPRPCHTAIPCRPYLTRGGSTLAFLPGGARTRVPARRDSA